jgi:hypothetical protein
VNRLERIQEVLRMEGLAAAANARAQSLREELETDAREELAAQGTAVTWRIADLVTVALPMSKERAKVTDAEALKTWVKEHYPEQITTAVRPAFMTMLLSLLVCRDGKVYTRASGEVVPGMAVQPGGVPLSLRFAPEPDVAAVYGALGEKLLADVLAATEPVVVLVDNTAVPA